MNTQEKEQSVQRLRENFLNSHASYLLTYHGCTAAEITGLRRKLRLSGSKFSVVKNTLAKRAIADTPASGLEKMFSGPTAVVWSPTDPVAPAKLLTEFAADREHVKLKGGFVDGSVVGGDQFKALASMPSKEQLVANLLALINAPATRLLQTINAPATNLVRLLDAWRVEKGKSAE